MTTHTLHSKKTKLGRQHTGFVRCGFAVGPLAHAVSLHTDRFAVTQLCCCIISFFHFARVGPKGPNVCFASMDA
jgi:hypothetical protein